MREDNPPEKEVKQFCGTISWHTDAEQLIYLPKKQAAVEPAIWNASTDAMRHKSKTLGKTHKHTHPIGQFILDFCRQRKANLNDENKNRLFSTSLHTVLVMPVPAF